jgi:hydrogenase maturation protease
MNFGATDRFADEVRTSHVLVIGFGNTLRTDDGAGPTAVAQLAMILPHTQPCQCLVVQQLTPELAEPVSRADRVIFVDATIHVPPGEITVQTTYGKAPDTAGLGHHMTPELVLAMSLALYGRAPQAWTIGIGVDSMDVGEYLTPQVACAADRVAQHLAHWVAGWSQPSAIY